MSVKVVTVLKKFSFLKCSNFIENTTTKKVFSVNNMNGFPHVSHDLDSASQRKL